MKLAARWSWVAVLALVCYSGEVNTEIAVVIISEDVFINNEESTVLTCVGFSDQDADTRITWMENGEILSNTTTSLITEQDITQGSRHFKSSFLQLCSFTLVSVTTFTCVVSNGISSANSTVNLTLYGYTDLILLSNDTSVSSEEDVVFVCVGLAAPVIDISWSRDGTSISNTTNSVIQEEYFILDSLTLKRSYLYLCSISACDSFGIQCTVSNGTASVDNTIMVTITDPVELVLTTNSTTLYNVSDDSGIVLSCVGHGRPNLAFIWKYNNEVLTNSTRKYVTHSTIQVDGRLFTESYLYLCDLESCDSGNYSCILGSPSCTSNHFDFDVEIEGGPYIVALSDDTSVMAGESIGLECIGADEETPSIEWFKNGANLYNSTKVTIIEEVMVRDTGEHWKLSYLTFCDVETMAGGTITCSVDRNNCSRSSSLNLTVNYILVNVEILQLSNATQVRAGGDTSIFCEGVHASHVRISWSYEGMELTNSSLHRITEHIYSDGDMNIMRSSLQLMNLQKCTSGNYTCTISNQTSSAQSAVPVNVTHGNFEIVKFSNSTTVKTGDSSTLECFGFGESTSDINITWSQDNQPVHNSSDVIITEELSNYEGKVVKISSLIQKDVQIENEGMYTCTVWVDHCSVSSSLSLAVTENVTASRRLAPGTVAAAAVVATAGGVAATAGGCALIAYILKYAKKVTILKKIGSKIHKIVKQVKGDSDDDDDNDSDDEGNEGNEKGKSMRYAKKGKGIIAKIINKIKRTRASRQRKARREAAAKAKESSKKNGERNGAKSSKRPSNEYDVPTLPPHAAKKSSHGTAKKSSHNDSKKTSHDGTKKKSSHSTAKKSPHGSDKKATHKKNLEKPKEAKTETNTYANNDINPAEEAIYEEID